MAMFLCSRLSSGYCGNRRRLLMLCLFILTGLIYFLRQKEKDMSSPYVPLLSDVEMRHLEDDEEFPLKTSWGAPLVWGDSEWPVWGQRGVRAGLVVLAVGKYNHFLRGLLSSAEIHFLRNFSVTYYVLTDRPRELDPVPKLGPNRELKVVPVSEMPGWERLGLRRVALLASFIGEKVRSEVDYIFSIDVDQMFINKVAAEILGKLTATLHPEFYGKPRYYFPYEEDPDSMAYISQAEGDYYYTSEFYGGVCSEMLALTQACSLLILQDQERGLKAQELEESYLNRYLVNRRPTRVLSPEYSWWDSPQAPQVPTKRLLSIGRQCLSTGNLKGDTDAC